MGTITDQLITWARQGAERRLSEVRGTMAELDAKMDELRIEEREILALYPDARATARKRPARSPEHSRRVSESMKAKWAAKKAAGQPWSRYHSPQRNDETATGTNG